MRYTFVGTWLEVSDGSQDFVVVAEGETFGEARDNAAAAVLGRFPHRARSGEVPYEFWEEDAYLIAAFDGDLAPIVFESATLLVIA
ncbi:hypothetical protein ACFC7A_26890 [Streptomyces niveus]|uniref:hypothetical protein n=1 Tax=Streptomyces niveus TaxID=193462 RepID=UPI0035D7B9A8